MARGKKKLSLEVEIKAHHGDMPKVGPEAMAPKEDDDEKKYEQEGHWDLDQLMRAEEIRQDPKRMKYVHKAHEKKFSALRSIADLKAVADMKAMEAANAKKFKKV